MFVREKCLDGAAIRGLLRNDRSNRSRRASYWRRTSSLANSWRPTRKRSPIRRANITTGLNSTIEVTWKLIWNVGRCVIAAPTGGDPSGFDAFTDHSAFQQQPMQQPGQQPKAVPTPVARSPTTGERAHRRGRAPRGSRGVWVHAASLSTLPAISPSVNPQVPRWGGRSHHRGLHRHGFPSGHLLGRTHPRR